MDTKRQFNTDGPLNTDGPVNKKQKPTTVDSTIMFDDESDMKLLLLSLFAHDPCHDFYGESRTLKNKGYGGKYILKNLQIIFNNIKLKQIASGGGKDSIILQTSNEFEESLRELTLDECIIVSKQYVKDVFPKEFTNMIFGDALATSVRLSSKYKTSQDNKDNIFTSSQIIKNQIYENLNNYYIKSLSFYGEYSRPIIDVFESGIAEKRKNVTVKFFERLQDAIVSAEKELGTFLDNRIDNMINSVDSKIPNIYQTIQDDMDVIKHIKTRPIFKHVRVDDDACINKIMEMNENNYTTPKIADCIMKYTKEYLLTYHPDKIASRGDMKLNHLKTVFNVNSEDDVLKNLFKENTTYRDKIMTFAKKIRELYGTKQFGGGNPQDEEDIDVDIVIASSMNKTLLKEIVRWVLLYLNCATEISDANGHVVFIPTFEPILKSDTTYKQKAKKYILNAQILILYCFYYGSNKDALKYISNKNKNKPIYTYYLSEYLFPIGQRGVPNWLNGSFPDKADESIKMASEIIINKMLKDHVLYDKNVEIIDVHKLLFGTTTQRFIINNASPLSDTLFKKITKDDLNKRVYCPAASIADAMSNCSYKKSTEQIHNDLIYPMNLHIENIKGQKYIYSIKSTLSYSENTHTLSIDGIVSIEDNPITININKNIDISKQRYKDLSAVETYRDMVSKMVTLFSNEQINNKDNNNDIFTNFVRSNAKSIIELGCIKSIGDWGQEVTSVSRFGAYANNNIEQFKISMNNSEIIPYDENGEAIRLGIAGDRPSAFRMIYMNIFANPESKNNKAVVGYVNNTASYIVYNPDTFNISTKLPKGGTRRKHKQKKSRKRKSNKYSRRGR
jgi:hypothetical protein